MLIKARPRRFRPKLWMSLLLPIVATIPILAWSGINPFRRDPAAVAIDYQEEWAAQGTASLGIATLSPATPGNDHLRTEEATVSQMVNCVVKLAYVVPGSSANPPHDLIYHYRSAWIGQNGVTGQHRSYNFAEQGGWDSIGSDQLSRARTLVAKLSPAPRRVEPRAALVVGLLQGKDWEVRTYDRKSLPVGLAELIGMAGLRLE